MIKKNYEDNENAFLMFGKEAKRKFAEIKKKLSLYVQYNEWTLKVRFNSQYFIRFEL